MNIMSELQNIKNWKKTHKKSYEIWVCKPNIGTKCENKFEGTQYTTDKNKQFILSGTAGEQWVIDGNKLAKTYTFADGSQITPETVDSKSKNGLMNWTKVRTRPDAGLVWAFHLPLSVKDFPVNTSWGDTLIANRSGVGHGKGDFIMASDGGGVPNLNDVWVVNGVIFPKTYDLHAFSGMFRPDEYRNDNCEMPRYIMNTYGLQQHIDNSTAIVNNMFTGNSIKASNKNTKSSNTMAKANNILKATLCKKGFRVNETIEEDGIRLDIDRNNKNNFVIVQESNGRNPGEITMYCMDQFTNETAHYSFAINRSPNEAKAFVTRVYDWIMRE